MELTLEQKKAIAIASARLRAKSPKKFFGQTLKENIMGDNDPTTQNFGEKLGTFLNKAGESMTFGLIGDEADAAMAAAIPGGMGYDERLAQSRQQETLFEKTNPGAALGADIGGALVGAALPFGAIGTLGKGAGLMSRIGASTAAGAGMGGTYGFMEGEGTSDRLGGAKTGALIGGAAGAVAPVVGAGVQKIADSRALSKGIKAAAKGAKSTDELLQEGRGLYNQIDEAGVQIKPQAFSDARKGILDNLRTKTGFDELPGPGSLTPNAARVNQIMGAADDTLTNTPTAGLPFKSLDQMRRQAGAAAGNVANKTDQAAGMEIINGLDDFVKRLKTDDILAGDVKTLQEALPKARDVWGRMIRSQKIDDAIASSEDYLSGRASGIRNQFSKLLKNEKTRNTFSQAEQAAMRRAINGSIPEQILNLMGGGLGQLTQVAGGSIAGGPVGFATGVATAAASRKAAEAVALKNAETVRALVSNGLLGNLPVATDSARKLSEGLLRRSLAVQSQ